MRKILFSVAIFLLLANPMFADSGDEGYILIALGPVTFFDINNAAPLSFTYDQYSDFGVAQDLGDIDYDLIANAAWEVTAIILDDTTGGQTSDDWDDLNWTLTVNGATIDESTSNVIDSDSNPIFLFGGLWEVLLTIPWPESSKTADCIIELTASTI